jgi:type II secretory pathway predicted ATPase ExeA
MQVTLSQANAISIYLSGIILISLWIAYRRNRKLTLASQLAMPSGLLGFSPYSGKRQPSASQLAREMQEGIVRRVAVAESYEATRAKVPSFGRPQLVQDLDTNGNAAVATLECPEPAQAEVSLESAAVAVLEIEELSGSEVAGIIETDLSAIEEQSVCSDCTFEEEIDEFETVVEIPSESDGAAASEALDSVELELEHTDFISPSVDFTEKTVETLLDESSSPKSGATDIEFSFPKPAETEENSAALFAVEHAALSTNVTANAESFAESIVQSFPGPAAQSEIAAPAFLNFFGLNEQPFGVTPDPAYIYPSRMHSEAISSLQQGIHNLRGFMTLIAEPGMGKTTLLNKLMEELQDTARVVFLFQTQCNPSELLGYLLGELGVESAGMDLPAMHKTLNEILFREMLLGRRFVLIVDEAQNLNESTLETIRLLSDFETSNAKLIQIVLAGQPQLVDTLKQPSLSQLRQRIAVLSKLEPLSVEETANYVRHRLRASGAGSEPIFTDEALALITECSQGTPRKINNLCFDALVLACSEGRTTIDTDIVQRVDAKLSLNIFARRPEPVASNSPAADSNLMGDSSQLARLLLSALANHNRQESAPVEETPAVASIGLTGKVTEIIKAWTGNKNSEYRVQVSLRRETSSEIPVAERYYSCSFYVEEKEAKTFQVGQSVTFKIEQN